MTWFLFIDDLRDPGFPECVSSGVNPNLPWVIARTSSQARAAVEQRGMPTRMALDHDLGEFSGGQTDEVPKFLGWLAYEYWNGNTRIPDYTIHSANKVGAANMKSFMDSWKKSQTIEER